MIYKLDLLLVLKKKKKKRLINIKSFKNHFFFMVYLYWIPRLLN